MRTIKTHDMDDDDIPIGRVLSRREMLTLLAGTGGVLLLAGCGDASQTPGATSTTTSAATTTAGSTSTVAATTAAAGSATTAVSSGLVSCVLLPALTEGPYFVDEKLNRSDIRSDPSDNAVKEGTQLKLAVNVYKVGSGGCVPYTGAFVDIWHCDAAGTYSDVNDTAVGFNTKGKKYLRGYQATDANGKAAFTTIYPGWYQGRAVHIHFKIRASLDSSQAYSFTSQFFFDDNLTDTVQAKAPYASKGQRTLRNSGDNIYQNGGSQLLLNLTADGSGYTTTFNIGLQVS